MKREVKIDRPVYLVDDDEKSYVFLKCNHDWINLDLKVNQENKKSIDGYTRTFRDGGKKVFQLK
jgi:hypothetical protein